MGGSTGVPRENSCRHREQTPHRRVPVLATVLTTEPPCCPGHRIANAFTADQLALDEQSKPDRNPQEEVQPSSKASAGWSLWSWLTSSALFVLCTADHQVGQWLSVLSSVGHSKGPQVFYHNKQTVAARYPTLQEQERGDTLERRPIGCGYAGEPFVYQ